GQADLIVPVPLHWTRRLSRGYDQAALLAAAAGRLPVRIEGQVLRRRRRTAAQTGQSARAREANLRRAFTVIPRRREQIVGRRILLVDDVVTTGATLAAAARALVAAGATEVRGFAVARA